MSVLLQDEDDALDAFMAGIEKEVTENKPSVRPKAELALDEDDAVADYMEVTSYYDGFRTIYPPPQM